MDNFNPYYIPQRKGELLAYLLRLYPNFKGLRSMPKKQLTAMYCRIRDERG